jgi:hypothetical protein
VGSISSERDEFLKREENSKIRPPWDLMFKRF